MSKQELRKIYLQKRSLLSEQDVSELSHALSDRLFHNIDFTNIISVHLFLPIRKKNEINTWLIMDRLRKEQPHIKIVIPKTEGSELHSFEVTERTVLEENVWGIPEPVDANPYPSYLIDLVLMPLLAFDTAGNRIGYGKGFYDRFLMTCKKEVIKVGLSFFDAEERVEVQPFDVPMHYCITPGRFYSFI